MMRFELESAVKQIVGAAALESRLIEATDEITLLSRLQDDLSMDEVDLVDLMFRAENRFCIALPGIDVDASYTVSDLVALIAERLSEKEARVVGARDDARSTLLSSSAVATASSSAMATR